MSDIESDTENRPLPTIQISNASSPSSSSFEKEKYRAQQLEKLLKTSIDSKYVILKHTPSLTKSDVWKNFGFPAKSPAGGGHEAIPGFIACFDRFKILSYDESTKYWIFCEFVYINKFFLG